eukprot:GHVR01134607.1.p1 GENE.GHVR01134607.1~~GHVR01134607.1.p1  ORF type:complete len:121 (-),score=69.55 GHVR01134607.1:59-421(-)
MTGSGKDVSLARMLMASVGQRDTNSSVHCSVHTHTDSDRLTRTHTHSHIDTNETGRISPCAAPYTHARKYTHTSPNTQNREIYNGNRDGHTHTHIYANSHKTNKEDGHTQTLTHTHTLLQ